MMHDAYEWMWSMHWSWWIFCIIVLVALVAVFARGLMPGQFSKRSVTPLETLQRRYAAGEISTEEFEERKSRL